MDLTTTYLGLKLPHPLIAGASPLVDSLDQARALEDAGAAAVVMHSLFEEQIVQDQWSTFAHEAQTADSSPEATSYFPARSDYRLGPDQYLEQIRRLKQALHIPVIGSLNGARLGGWIDHARLIEQAGADALELNVYHVATDADESGEEVEARVLEVVRAVRAAVDLPLAVKLSPFYSSLPHLCAGLELLGANGLVLFNRFYQPDIDPELLEIAPRLELSTSSELRLRLRWLAILRGRLRASLACSGGIHRPVDVIKAVMAGADAVQVVSALLHFGTAHLGLLLEGLRSWMEAHEYASLAQMKGSMSAQHCPDPEAYERANYLKVLQIWKV